MFEATLDATALTKILKKMGAAPADMSPTMAVVAEMLVAAVDENFQTAGHGKWPPLAESTLRGRRGGIDLSVGSQRESDAKAAYYESAGAGNTPEQAAQDAGRAAQSGMILLRTGALAASQHGEHGPDFAMVGTDKFYAVFHVSDAPRKIIPLRNFYDIPEDTYEEATMIILSAIAE